MNKKEVFIADTNIKANADTKKRIKEQGSVAPKQYAKALIDEVNMKTAT